MSAPWLETVLTKEFKICLKKKKPLAAQVNLSGDEELCTSLPACTAVWHLPEKPEPSALCVIAIFVFRLPRKSAPQGRDPQGTETQS